MRILSSFIVASPGQPDGSGGLGFGAIEIVRFGRRDVFVPANQWNMQMFSTYAVQAELAAISLLNLHSDGVMQITTGSGSMGISSGGAIDIFALSGNLLIQANSGDATLQSLSVSGSVRLISSAAVIATAPSIGIFAQSGFQVGRGVSDPAFFSSYDNSLFCPSGTTNAFRSATRFADDLVLELGSSIISANPDRFLRLGPGVEACNGVFRSSGTVMQLQDDTATKTIEVRGKFTNSEAATPITFYSPSGGADFANTPIFDSDGELDIIGNAKITGATDFGGTADFNGDVNSISGVTRLGTLSFQSSTITNSAFSLQINSGVTTFSGNVNCAGGLCICDMRTKRNVSKISKEDSLRIILNTSPIEYQLEPWFEDAKDITPGTIFRGFSAQRAQKDIPQSVAVMNHTVGDHHFDDLLNLKKGEFVPDLIGSIHALHSMIGKNKNAANIVAEKAQAEVVELFSRQETEVRLRRKLETRVSNLEDKLEDSQKALDDAIALYKDAITNLMSKEAMRLNQVLYKVKRQAKNVEKSISEHTRTMQTKEADFSKVLETGRKSVIALRESASNRMIEKRMPDARKKKKKTRKL